MMNDDLIFFRFLVTDSDIEEFEEEQKMKSPDGYLAHDPLWMCHRRKPPEDNHWIFWLLASFVTGLVVAGIVIALY